MLCFVSEVTGIGAQWGSWQGLYPCGLVLPCPHAATPYHRSHREAGGAPCSRTLVCLMHSADLPLGVGETCKVGDLVSAFFGMKYCKGSCCTFHDNLDLIKIPVGKNP